MVTKKDVEAAYKEHMRYVRHVLWRYGVRAQDVDDVAQDVFLATLEHLDRAASYASLRHWLRGVSRNIALDRSALNRRRSRLRVHVRYARENSSPTYDLEAVVDARHRLAMANDAVVRLSIGHREALLDDIGGVSKRATAERLSVSPGSAAHYTYRARQHVAAHVAAHDKLCLKRGQEKLLVELARARVPVTVRQLAVRCSMRPGQAGGVVNSLVQLGLAARRGMEVWATQFGRAQARPGQ